MRAPGHGHPQRWSRSPQHLKAAQGTGPQLQAIPLPQLTADQILLGGSLRFKFDSVQQLSTPSIDFA